MVDSATFPAFGATTSGTVNGTLNITSYTEEYDTLGNFAAGVYTVPSGKDGVHLFTAGVGVTNFIGRLELFLIKNGAVVAADFAQGTANTNDPACSIAKELKLVAGDTVSLRAVSPDASGTLTSDRSYFTGSLKLPF